MSRCREQGAVRVHLVGSFYLSWFLSRTHNEGSYFVETLVLEMSRSFLCLTFFFCHASVADNRSKTNEMLALRWRAATRILHFGSRTHDNQKPPTAGRGSVKLADCSAEAQGASKGPGAIGRWCPLRLATHADHPWIL